jgi:predicted phage-related endonuclease
VYNIISERDKSPHKERKKKMSRNELITKIEQLKEWEAILEEAQAEAEALRDSIKAQMLEENTEELAVGTYIVRWTAVLSNRFDSTAFKKEHAELYKTFTKQVASRRFTIA